MDRKTNPILILSYLTIIALWFLSPVILIPYVVNVLVLVTCILYAACHWSISLLDDGSSSTEDGSSGDDSNGSSGEHSINQVRGETMSRGDAYQFPLVGSVSLFSLYAAFKYLDPSWVNIILGGYLGMVGCFALTCTLAPVLSTCSSVMSSSQRSFLHRNVYWKWEMAHPFKIPEFLFGPSPFLIEVEFQIIEVVAILPALVFTGLYLQSRHWTMNNVLGIYFCLQGIQRFSLGTYKTGAILLIGLFFYDIFWVFGTEVMVTVAKSLDGPIKILFPRSLERNADGKIDLSLLGLGDIVIPGFFLALLLRFDASRAALAIAETSEPVPSQKKEEESSEKAITNERMVGLNIHSSFPKPYFHSALIAYVVGLGTTMFVMIYFQAAQPALLYLVPACLLSSMGCATLRGEVKELFEYSEELEEEEEGVEGEDEKKDKDAKKDD